ncbi:HmuY family protein [Roseisolibacter sp. H3M3-2]|uniref:HmuY family protein n=1 Tax=Roseisolibacter sp. H3M3-2 TaxID=3031323 RepID=UPI0023D9911C|nr:HmuY family protein [Roseisolibacter sp. H3M3-2]MDF1503745.1 HmuY family protein [Roseisolibacter sp. H3M3-2]
MSRTRSLLALPALVLAGCASDDVTAPLPPAAGVFTVDAATRWVYVSLGDSAVVTPTPSAGESAAWDVAFNATNVTLNGGAAGPGGVTGYCVCQNAAANPSNAQWLALTAEGERADFDAITAVPAGAAFTADALTPAVTGWYLGSGASAAASPDSAYLVRLSDSSGVAKVRVTRLEGASATSAGRVTVEYALANNGDVAFGATRTATLDLTTGAKSLDLQTGTAVTGANWELRFDGFAARVNGGVSGPGNAAAAKLTTATFAAATPAATAANAYRTDVYAGVFNTSRFYRYNLGGDNRITPTFDVYLLRRGSAVYKFQIVDYYSATGQARHYTFRYQRIAG